MIFQDKNFPTFADTRRNELSKRELKKLKNSSQTDSYFIYQTNEEEIVFEWVDKWFKDASFINNEQRYYSKIWSIKKVDEKTSKYLYNKLYNPFSIVIQTDYPYKDRNTLAIKAMIHSIDDSSIGIWFNNLTLERAEHLRNKIVEYIDSQLILNGDSFINFTIEELGAKIEDLDCY